jgi:hypothetical protein
MNWYITFSGDRYHIQASNIVKRAPLMGAERVLIYDDIWLHRCRPQFCEQNRWFFDLKQIPMRGAGWYIWKPYIILDALNRVAVGDYILYTDGDTYPIRDFSMLFPLCNSQGGIMVFDCVGQDHQKWCKRDCFIVMGMDEPRWRFVPHVCGRFLVIQKGSDRARQFIEDWLKWVCVPDANTVLPSHLAPEYPEYVEHRSDQSVLTNLAHKYELRLFREACSFGNSSDKDKNLYPQLFEQLGGHNFAPSPCVGSQFRNVND